MTALQPLTDTQVQNRLDAYNPGGALERDIRARLELFYRSAAAAAALLDSGA